MSSLPAPYPEKTGLTERDVKRIVSLQLTEGPPTAVSFLSHRPEIVQSTGFELQIREEEDEPGGLVGWRSARGAEAQ